MIERPIRQRHITACNASVEREFVAEHTPTYRMDERIAEARERMGEARWQQLNDEWGTPSTPSTITQTKDEE